MLAGDAAIRVPLDGPFDVVRSLPTLGTATDPTWQGRAGVVAFAGRSPAGPVTARARVAGDDLEVEAWGPGAGWLCERGPQLAAHHDDPRTLTFGHEHLDEINRRNPGLRHAATGLVVDGLLGRIPGQRVLAVEAARSWVALCRDLGGPAPGPLPLLLPPDHEALADQPTHWFHARGIELGRARTMIGVARRARSLAAVVDLPLAEAYARLRAMPGLGPWTVNGIARTALGDPDAIVVGDYWICHTVCSFFTGRSRGSDEEMLGLVAPWVGQRGRVERLVYASGHRIQRFAPGRRTPNIRRL